MNETKRLGFYQSEAKSPTEGAGKIILSGSAITPTMADIRAHHPELFDLRDQVQSILSSRAEFETNAARIGLRAEEAVLLRQSLEQTIDCCIRGLHEADIEYEIDCECSLPTSVAERPGVVSVRVKNLSTVVKELHAALARLAMVISAGESIREMNSEISKLKLSTDRFTSRIVDLMAALDETRGAEEMEQSRRQIEKQIEDARLRVQHKREQLARASQSMNTATSSLIAGKCTAPVELIESLAVKVAQGISARSARYEAYNPDLAARLQRKARMTRWCRRASVVFASGTAIGLAYLAVTALDGAEKSDAPLPISAPIAYEIPGPSTSIVNRQLNVTSSPDDEFTFAELMERCSGTNLDYCSDLLGMTSSGGPASDAQSLRVYEGMCEKGHGIFCYGLGNAHFKGVKGLSKDKDKAIYLYADACNLNYPRACERVALLLVKGQSGPQNNSEAAAVLLQKACLLAGKGKCLFNDNTEQLSLGGREVDVKAIKVSPADALVVIETQQGQSHVMSIQVADGNRFVSPRRVDKEIRQCSDGDAPSCNELRKWFGEDKVAPTSRRLRVASLLCDRNEPIICTYLGVAYHRGEMGLSVDTGKAAEYMAKGCSLGESAGCKNLAEYVNKTGGREIARILAHRACYLAGECPDAHGVKWLTVANERKWIPDGAPLARSSGVRVRAADLDDGFSIELFAVDEEAVAANVGPLK